MLKRQTIEAMLDRLGEAVSSGDLKKVSATYVFPVVFMIDDNASIIEKPEDFEEMFGEGRKWYTDQGIVETRAEILRIDEMTESIASVDVRWPGFNDTGVKVYAETSHYILQLVDDQPLIRVALTRTKEI